MCLTIAVHQTLLLRSSVEIYQSCRLGVVYCFVTLYLWTERIDGLVCCSLINLDCNNEAHENQCDHRSYCCPQHPFFLRVAKIFPKNQTWIYCSFHAQIFSKKLLLSVLFTATRHPKPASSPGTKHVCLFSPCNSFI